MSPTFNDTKESQKERTSTSNQAGGPAYHPESPLLELYKLTATSMLESETDYYAHDEIRDISGAFEAAAEDGLQQEILELAAHARNEMGVRDVSILLYVMAANSDKFVDEDPENTLVRDYGPRIFRRMDGPATAIAMNEALFGQTAPKPLKKGAADAIDQMLEPDYERGAYRLGKYKQPNREITLWDTVNRTHVRRYAGIEDGTYKDELMTRLMEGDLRSHEAVPLDPPGTWENIVSDMGNTAEAWRTALEGREEDASHGMGIMARIRNLRNMLEAGLSADEVLTDDEYEAVRHSRMFPFRLYTAYQQVTTREVEREMTGSDRRHIDGWFEEAIDISVENIPDEWTDTFVAVDLSGSMSSNSVSRNSVVTCDEIATFFGAVLMHKGADVGAFGNQFKRVTAHMSTPALELMDKISGHATREMSRGTDASLVFEHLHDEVDREYDRVVFLTDMQAWGNTRGFTSTPVDEMISAYRGDSHDPAFYFIDLNNYGDLLTPEDYPNVFDISGWNSKVLDFAAYAENPQDVLDEVVGRDD